MAQLPISASPSPATLQALLPRGGRAQLSAPQQRVAQGIADYRAGKPSAVDAGDWAFFEAAYKGSAGMAPRFNLSDLPVEVAQAIVDARAKSMEQFFETWARSIEENAKADHEASERAQRLKEELGKPQDVRRQRLLFAGALNRLVQAGQIAPADAKAHAARAGLADRKPNAPLSRSGWQAQPQRLAGLALPNDAKTGFNT